MTTITAIPAELRRVGERLLEINRELANCLPAEFQRNGAIQEAYDRTGAMVNDAKRAARAIERAIREAGGE